MLLAAYDARRPTRDVDAPAREITGERDAVLRLVRDIAAVAKDDGLVFDTDAATAQIIRDEDCEATTAGATVQRGLFWRYLVTWRRR